MVIVESMSPSGIKVSDAKLLSNHYYDEESANNLESSSQSKSNINTSSDINNNTGGSNTNLESQKESPFGKPLTVNTSFQIPMALFPQTGKRIGDFSKDNSNKPTVANSSTSATNLKQAEMNHLDLINDEADGGGSMVIPSGNTMQLVNGAVQIAYPMKINSENFLVLNGSLEDMVMPSSDVSANSLQQQPRIILCGPNGTLAASQQQRQGPPCICGGKALSLKNQAVQVPSPPIISPPLQVLQSQYQVGSILPAHSSANMVALNPKQLSPVATQLALSSTSTSAATTAANAGPRRLHVTNLPFKVKDDQLRKMFEDHGVVSEAEIIYNERGSKGFGFVTMATIEDAVKARDALNGKELQGRKIEVNNATPRTNASKANTSTTNRTLLKSPGNSLNGFVRTRSYGPSYTGNWNPRHSPSSAYLAAAASVTPTIAAAAATGQGLQLTAVPPAATQIPFTTVDAAQQAGLAAGFAAASVSQQAQQDAYAAYYNYALSQAQQAHQQQLQQQQQQLQQQGAVYRGTTPGTGSTHATYGAYRYQPY